MGEGVEAAAGIQRCECGGRRGESETRRGRMAEEMMEIGDGDGEEMWARKEMSGPARPGSLLARGRRRRDPLRPRFHSSSASFLPFCVNRERS